MKTVMCFGTFDILHLGHLYYFEQAKKYGNYLIVVIARDKTKQKQKKKIIFSEQERLQLVQSLKVVDEAVLGNYQDHLQIIREKRPEVIMLGYDHPIREEELKEKLSLVGLHPVIKRARPYRIKTQKSGKLKEQLLRM